MPFDLQPTLQGGLVALRPMRADDYDALFAVAADPLIWDQHPSSDRYKNEVFRVFFREAMESGGALVAYDAMTGDMIGSSRYNGYNEARNEVEIGWTFLARSYWGGKYNGEMKRLMLDHAFRFVDRVLFVIGRDNQRSRRAVEKIGGVFIGRKQDPGGIEKVVYKIEPSGSMRAGSNMTTIISAERPDTHDAAMLIEELETHLTPLYPSESRHGYSVEKMLAQNVAFFLVRQDGEPAGCGGVQLHGAEYGELKRMYVRPQYRGLGLGRRILEHLEEYARSREVKLLRLETGIHQHEAIAMYERTGFTLVPPFGEYKPDPLSCFYEKRIG